jgi:hypothetical protein
MNKLKKEILADNENWLYQEYIINERGIKNIADQLKVSDSAIETRLKNFNIKIRNTSESAKIRAKTIRHIPSKEEIKIASQKRKNGIYIKCLYCENLIYQRKSEKRKFCSRKCKGLYQRYLSSLDDHYLWRRNLNYRDWQKFIFKRDGKKCKICNSNKNINAHHIIYAKNNKELRYNKDNGITLCEKCHKIIHSKNIKNICILLNIEYYKNIDIKQIIIKILKKLLEV